MGNVTCLLSGSYLRLFNSVTVDVSIYNQFRLQVFVWHSADCAASFSFPQQPISTWREIVALSFLQGIINIGKNIPDIMKSLAVVESP